MEQADGGEFVEGWLVAQLLGEGAYGEVRLLVHARTGACVALKAVRGGAGDAAGGAAAAAREAALHRALRHAHVLRCLGARAHGDAHYTFLEYAAGGDLFERIEPDLGMPEGRARRYFLQLLRGLAYLHARGLAHRDIKPENLLLDHYDQLKISDFGMATVFRHGEGRERLLSRVCGTVPYAAPEVLSAAARPYRAQPADLWSAAVVLVAMLAGELPWERAQSSADARYAEWERGEPAPAAGVWRKVRGAARALLRRALHPAPAARATLPQVMQHRWLERDEETDGGGAPAERAWRSQPAAEAAPPAPPPAAPAELSPAAMEALISYSQPSRAEDLVLPPSLDATAQAAGALRLTRVPLAAGGARALEAARARLCACGLRARLQGARALLVECGEGVAMRAWAVPRAGGGALLEVRRARGCGLRFQRRFRDLRRALAPLAPPDPLAPPAPMDTEPA